MIGFSPILDKNISKNSLILQRKQYTVSIRNYVRQYGNKCRRNLSLRDRYKGRSYINSRKYMHQPCEVVDVNDIESVSNLIYAYVSDKAGEPNA